MQKRSIALLALFALASVLAYYYYYYEAESLMFEGPSATLVLVGSVFLTGFLLSLPPGRHAHGHGHADGHHGHEHGHHHGHGHEGHEQHEHPAMPPTGKQG